LLLFSPAAAGSIRKTTAHNAVVPQMSPRATYPGSLGTALRPDPNACGARDRSRLDSCGIESNSVWAHQASNRCPVDLRTILLLSPQWLILARAGRERGAVAPWRRLSESEGSSPAPPDLFFGHQALRKQLLLKNFQVSGTLLARGIVYNVIRQSFILWACFCARFDRRLQAYRLHKTIQRISRRRNFGNICVYRRSASTEEIA
jgi:hypothetical protein